MSGLVTLVLLSALSQGATTQAPRWEDLTELHKTYLLDRYCESKASWDLLSPSARRRSLDRAEARAAERKMEVEELAASVRGARTLQAWDVIDQRIERSLAGLALGLWVKDGKALDTSLGDYDRLRRHAAAGALTAEDLAWARMNLEGADQERLRSAWKSMQAAKDNASLSRAQTAMASAFFGSASGENGSGDSLILHHDPETDPDNPARDVQLEAEYEFDEKARSFLRRVMNKLLESPSGRRLLKETVREYKRARRSLAIALAPPSLFKGSSASLESGVQTIVGAPVEYADSERGRAEINPGFLEFEDADLAAAEAASTLAHELEHLRLHAFVDRSMPRHARSFKSDFTDERSAHLSGWIAALELTAYRAEPTMDTEQIREYLENGRRFWLELNMLPGYAARLDFWQLANPYDFYRFREVMLRIMRETEERRLEVLGTNDPKRKELERSIVDWRRAEAAARERLAGLKGPLGSARIEALRAAFDDEDYREIYRKTLGQERKLLHLLFFSRLPRSRAPAK